MGGNLLEECFDAGEEGRGGGGGRLEATGNAVIGGREGGEPRP